MASFGKILIGGLAATIGGGIAGNLLLNNNEEGSKPNKRELPTRDEEIECLQKDHYDVIVIGGGASGAGCALDAATRGKSCAASCSPTKKSKYFSVLGLKTALIEADDFSSGTSSRSTKLIHGGVRYLQKAMMQLDYEQYKMVKEALHERGNMLESAPHLSHQLPIMLPVYRWWQVPYFWFGIKMYDVIAGRQTLKSSYYLSKRNTLETFPMLKEDNLCGGIVYYDGHFDDARMNLAIALTAAICGATVVNHVSVTGLTKDKIGQRECINGVCVKDELTGKTWEVKAKCVINATGPYTDCIRKMDDPSVKEICSPSSGVHIILPGYYCPEKMGLLDPSTSDGRVIFFLPWQNHTIAGTTDIPCEVTHNPEPTENEIRFILEEIKNYLRPDLGVTRSDVLSAWSGIRPLVSDPNKPDTQSLARNHIIHVSPSGLVTLAGGKWTTYRSMASDTIDKAIEACCLKPDYKKSQTVGLKMIGAEGWSPVMYIRLVQDFGLDCEVARHLANAYGDKAFDVAKMAQPTGKRWPIVGKRIHSEFPYIQAEVRYAVREFAMTAVDMISRRIRLAFLNVHVAEEALQDIVDIMAEELKWSPDEKQKQIKQATEFIENEMGLKMHKAISDEIPTNLSKEDIQVHVRRFKTIDRDRNGFISINDVRRSLQQHGERDVSSEQLHDILRQIDMNKNGQLELPEYLRMVSAVKYGRVSFPRLVNVADSEKSKWEKKILKKKNPSGTQRRWSVNVFEATSSLIANLQTVGWFQFL
ncbi:hypothetical protein NQ315_008148 [Exocentrus adspersus]|uniref:Glycerol-3-phosphate dehydrogenase n=1 Tax=Exocentrus adspersus TaxID=1586481 RepID=A0AAV8VVM5_9CUCU|nr:hypothetical protein NQ315_008148 [Exocentrus adspersus]